MIAEGSQLAGVDPERVEHRRGIEEGVDVGGGENSGVFGDDRVGGLGGDGVEVGLEDRPGVRRVLLEVGRGVDGGDRGPGAGLQVGDVLDLGEAVGAGAEAAEVAADQRRLRVAHGHVLGADPAGDVLGDAEALERHPGDDTSAVHAQDTAVLLDDDTTSWASWNLYAAELARDTGARAVRISDGGITGPAFFDHVRRSRRPIVNAPQGQTTPLPPDLIRRPVIAPQVYRTWSVVWRRGEERAAVLAVVDALTDQAGDLGIHRPDAWLPDSDPHKH